MMYLKDFQGDVRKKKDVAGRLGKGGKKREMDLNRIVLHGTNNYLYATLY